MEAPVVPARRMCELSGHREPHLDEDSLRSTLLLSFSDSQPARTTAAAGGCLGWKAAFGCLVTDCQSRARQSAGQRLLDVRT